MDLSRISDVMLFGQLDDGTGEFYVSRLWLEWARWAALSR
jgi:hypothetical protein